VIKQSSSYWRITIHNPPLNLWDQEMFAEMNVLMDDMESDTALKVVVFESGDKEFFVNHHDVERRDSLPNQPGAKSFDHWSEFVTRLAQSSVLSIAKVRGLARAQGFEFAPACDIRFASRERAVFALVEVAGAAIPGGSGIEWLAALVGRSRSLEIICGAADFDADTSERYGIINRSIPDSELDAFVDAFAKRVGSFEKRALALSKKLVNARAGVPSEGDLWTSNHLLSAVNTWPENKANNTRLLANGMNRVGDFELNLAERMAELAAK
jgi:enoyl-CoA hydratase/carnithine racemase